MQLNLFSSFTSYIIWYIYSYKHERRYIIQCIWKAKVISSYLGSREQRDIRTQGKNMSLMKPFNYFVAICIAFFLLLLDFAYEAEYFKIFNTHTYIYIYIIFSMCTLYSAKCTNTEFLLWLMVSFLLYIWLRIRLCVSYARRYLLLTQTICFDFDLD